MRLSMMLTSLAATVALSAMSACGVEGEKPVVIQEPATPPPAVQSTPAEKTFAEPGEETSVFSLWLAYDGFCPDVKVNGLMLKLFRPIPIAGGNYADEEFAQPGVAGLGIGLWGSETLDFDGVQIGGLWSRSRELDGLQLSGFANGCGDRMRGVQLAGVANGVTSRMRGVQLAGLVNSSEDMAGLQAAGAVNRVKTGRGVQIGLVNLCGGSDDTGLDAAYPSKLLQIGLLNRNHHGWWCPVINLSWPSKRHAVEMSK
ncbi:MAG: hypothetical protein J5985_00865 [Kiritimatiellae bacterium]|nr:hypothetical protein [Kiritimatiellia bacterium]